EVELDVLAGGHVSDAATGPLLGDLGERLQLLGVGQAVRQLHPDHVDALLALTVGTVDQAEGAPLVGRDVALLESLEHVDEGVDVLALGKTGTAHAVGNEVNDWIRAHDYPLVLFLLRRPTRPRTKARTRAPSPDRRPDLPPTSRARPPRRPESPPRPSRR